MKFATPFENAAWAILSQRTYMNVARKVKDNLSETFGSALEVDGVIYRTFPKHRRIPFDSTHAKSQYLVTIDGANHDTFVIENPRNAEIAAITIAFLDDAARAWFDEPGRSMVGRVRVSVEHK